MYVSFHTTALGSKSVHFLKEQPYLKVSTETHTAPKDSKFTSSLYAFGCYRNIKTLSAQKNKNEK